VNNRSLISVCPGAIPGLTLADRGDVNAAPCDRFVTRVLHMYSTRYADYVLCRAFDAHMLLRALGVSAFLAFKLQLNLVSFHEPHFGLRLSRV
jgi:hypothetical protein